MIGDHHGRSAGRATLLVRAVDAILGTHRAIPERGIVLSAASRDGGVHGYTGNKDDYLRRLRRIEGHVRGLQRMVEDDKYCIGILTQVSAATRALESVALGLLEELLGTARGGKSPRAVTPPRQDPGGVGRGTPGGKARQARGRRGRSARWRRRPAK